MSMKAFSVVVAGLLAASLLLPSRAAVAAVTSVSQVTMTGWTSTLDEGSGGTRRMLLVDIEADSATTLSEVSIWLEGTNLQSRGASEPDGYERGVKSVGFYRSDADGGIGSLAFNGALVFNDYYSATNSADNKIYAFSNIRWGTDVQIFLNLDAGHNYFVVVYDFDAPNNQPEGATRTIAGERYNVRLDYVKTVDGATTVANIMGPYLLIAGEVVGTTFEIDTSVYYTRDQLGIPVDPVVIAALKVTTAGTAATWNDLLIRAQGSGDDTRVARILIYEDTTGDNAFTPPSAGPPNDTLVATISSPFLADDGQAYHIFDTPITIAADTTKVFFFCYDFDPNAPDPTNNGFGFSVVNFGGDFKIVTPYDFTTLVTPTVHLLPLPPGVDVALGAQTPPTYAVNSTPLLTDRYPVMQVKITAHGINAAVSDMIFQWTTTSTARPETIYSLELWLDANNSGLGLVDATDMLLATLTHDEILASPNFFHFRLEQALQIRDRSFANVLLVAIFTDQAKNAYGFALFGDGIRGNFDFVRFYPSPAPLYSGWLVFNTSPPVSPTPTPTPTPTATTPLPPVGDGGTGGVNSSGNDTGIGVPGSIYDGSGGGCFVATAAFGAMGRAEVEALCEMRDSSLASVQAFGIVGLYYRVGPGLADAVRGAPALGALVRGHLLPLSELAR